MPRNTELVFKKGRVCRHHSGKIYTILYLTNTLFPSNKFPVTVVYIGANGNIWSRPLESFKEKFTVVYDGTSIIK